MIGRTQTVSNSLQLKLSAFISANYENNTLIRVCFSADHQSPVMGDPLFMQPFKPRWACLEHIIIEMGGAK